MGPRHCQGFRAVPVAQDTSASAAAERHLDAKAANASFVAGHSETAGKKAAPVTDAGGVDARALKELVDVCRDLDLDSLHF
jgi:hypothetical protein